MRKLLAVAFVLLAGSVEAHDCRIKKIDLKAYRKPEGLLIKALYYAYDGAVLNPRLCPDQNGPTWGVSGVPEIRQVWSPFGYEVLLLEPEPWTIIWAAIATVQRPDAEFTAEKRWCIDCR